MTHDPAMAPFQSRVGSRSRAGGARMAACVWLRAASGAALVTFGLGACTPDVDDDDGGTGGTSLNGGTGNGGASSGGRSLGGQATGGAPALGGTGGQGGAEPACVRAGGTVVTRLCCDSTHDFPNLCVTGACGCAPSSSHDTLVCQCPSGMCFDGQTCGADPHVVYATTDVNGSCPALQRVTLTLHNQSSSSVYLPGCGDYWVKNGETYTPNVVCAWEGIARPVPAGTSYVAGSQYSCPDAAGSVTLCLQVGFNCTGQGVPLSQAGCGSLQWVCAPSFGLIPTPQG